MTLSEFSIEFDVLYNNISSNQAPGLTEYEKSIFLTQAQESLVVELYKGSLGDSFENTEEVTRYLSSLVKTTQLEDYTIPEDCLFIVSVTDSDNNMVIAPTTHDRAIKEKKNPFKNNTERLLYLNEGNKIILLGDLPNSTINISYLSKPEPIILKSLENDFTINGESEESNTNLPESLHRTILLKAVQLAKAIWA